MFWYRNWKTIAFISYSKNLKTEFVTSKEVTASIHFPSSSKFIGGESKKFSICLFILNSSVSCGFVFVCWIRVSFFLKVTFHYSINHCESWRWNNFKVFSIILWKVFVLFCFRGVEVFGLWIWELSPGELFTGAIFFTLLTIVFFRNVIYFKENLSVIVSLDSIKSKQQI